MARRKKVFISFDYADKDLKDHFVRQSELREVQISIVDLSLVDEEPNQEWIAEANRQIQRCDVFMVIMGQNAHQAPGVLREVRMAAGLNKRRFQLKPKKRYGSPIRDAGDVIPWRWNRLEPWFSIDSDRAGLRG